MNRIVTLVLVLILSPITRTVSGQQRFTESSAVAKIKDKILKHSNYDTVSLKLRNGSQLKGRITGTSENMFTIREDQTRYYRNLSYTDVVKVKGGGLSRGAKFGILTALITGAVVIGALVSLKHSDPLKQGVLR